MQRFRIFLQKLPHGTLTIICTAAILWLTLANNPFGDTEPIQLFEGADKVVHAIMFGGLTWCILLDYQRRHAWQRPPVALAIIAVTASSLFGWAIELLQRQMALGRSYDPADLLADCLGTLLFALLYPTLSRFLTR